LTISSIGSRARIEFIIVSGTKKWNV